MRVRVKTMLCRTALLQYILRRVEYLQVPGAGGPGHETKVARLVVHVGRDYIRHTDGGNITVGQYNTRSGRTELLLFSRKRRAVVYETASVRASMFSTVHFR